MVGDIHSYGACKKMASIFFRVDGDDALVAHSLDVPSDVEFWQRLAWKVPKAGQAQVKILQPSKPNIASQKIAPSSSIPEKKIQMILTCLIKSLVCLMKKQCNPLN